MEFVNQHAPLKSAEETSLIIPKGLLNPHQTTIIKIPSKLYNAGPLLVVKNRNPNGTTNFGLKPQLTPLKEQPEEYVSIRSATNSPKLHYGDSELTKLLETKPLSGRKSSTRSVAFQPSKQVFSKSSVHGKLYKESVVKVCSIPSEVHTKVSCHRGSSNLFVTKPVTSEVVRSSTANLARATTPVKITSTRRIRLPPPEDRLPFSPFDPTKPKTFSFVKEKVKSKMDYVSAPHPSNFIKTPPDYYTCTIGKLFPNSSRQKSPQGGVLKTKRIRENNDGIYNPLEVIRSKLYNVPLSSSSRIPVGTKSSTRIRGSAGRKGRSQDNHHCDYSMVPVTVM